MAILLKYLAVSKIYFINLSILFVRQYEDNLLIISICGRRSEEDATTSFHRVLVVTTATTNQIRTLERRQAWLEAISHSGCTQICPTDRVCSKHFRNGENFDRCYGMLSQ